MNPLVDEGWIWLKPTKWSGNYSFMNCANKKKMQIYVCYRNWAYLITRSNERPAVSAYNISDVATRNSAIVSGLPSVSTSMAMIFKDNSHALRHISFFCGNAELNLSTQIQEMFIVIPAMIHFISAILWIVQEFPMNHCFYCHRNRVQSVHINKHKCNENNDRNGCERNVERLCWCLQDSNSRAIELLSIF